MVHFNIKKRQILSHVWLVRLGILVVPVGCLIVLGIIFLRSVSKTWFYNFTFPSSNKILSYQNKTNILILNKNRSIPVVMSIDLKNKSVSLIPVGRLESGPLVLAEANISHLINIPIQYGIILDGNKIVSTDLKSYENAILTRYLLEADPIKLIDPENSPKIN